MLNRSQIVFKAIDIFGYLPQNITHYRGIACIKDVAFNDAQIKESSGDLYYNEKVMKKCKETGKKMPVIINIHGGGFVEGDKSCRKSYSSFWAKKGYFVYNINYHLAPETHFPIFLNDCIDGLNFLIEINKYYQTLDLDKIIIMGDSSGGYTSAYLTALAFDDELRKRLQLHEIKLKPALSAPFCGIYDVDTFLDNNILPFQIMNSAAASMLGFDEIGVGKGFDALKDYEFFDCISPLPFINKNWCPVFVTWSNSDIICTNQGKPLYDKLVEVIGEENVGHFEVDGFFNNHCFHLNMATKASKDCLKAVNEFIFDKLQLEDLTKDDEPKAEIQPAKSEEVKETAE